MKKLFSLLLIIGMSISTSFSQIYDDEWAKKTSRQILDNIYNFKFTEAKALTDKLETKYKRHPVIPFLRAYRLSWLHLPLEKDQKEFIYYNQYLQLATQYAKERLERKEDDLEGNYFLMMTYGLLAQHEAESGDFMKSVGYGKKSYNYMKFGFGKENQYPDFHFSSGLYKFYAEQYPESHPIAKPFMMFFPNGNKKEGLAHLHQAIKQSQFSRVEARVYLMQIYPKYYDDYVKSVQMTQQLVNDYPQNPFFWTKHCEALAQVGRYAEAELYLSKFAKRSENMYRALYYLVKGWNQEKYYKKNAEAEKMYRKVLSLGKYDKRYTVNYYAFAYAGLARLADQKGDTKKAQSYYKEARKITEFEALKEVADAYIKAH